MKAPKLYIATVVDDGIAYRVFVLAKNKKNVVTDIKDEYPGAKLSRIERVKYEGNIRTIKSYIITDEG